MSSLRKASKWAGTFAADLSTAQGVERAVAQTLKTFGGPPGHPHQQPRRRQSVRPRGTDRRRLGEVIPGQLHGHGPHLPRARASDGGARLGVRRADRLRSRETAGAGVSGLRRVQERAALSDKGDGETVRAEGAGELCAARPDLVADVDATRGHSRADRGAVPVSTRTRRSSDSSKTVRCRWASGNPRTSRTLSSFSRRRCAKFITGANLDIGGTIRGLDLSA